MADQKKVFIVMATDSDQVHTMRGCNWLDDQGIPWKSVTVPCFSQTEKLSEVVEEIKATHPLAVIVIAGHSTGLPGLIAAGIGEAKIMVFGVRSSVPSGPSMIEDGTFNVSALPKGINVAYAGFNNPGFASACEMAAKLL